MGGSLCKEGGLKHKVPGLRWGAGKKKLPGGDGRLARGEGLSQSRGPNPTCFSPQCPCLLSQCGTVTPSP